MGLFNLDLMNSLRFWLSVLSMTALAIIWVESFRDWPDPVFRWSQWEPNDAWLMPLLEMFILPMLIVVPITTIEWYYPPPMALIFVFACLLIWIGYMRYQVMYRDAPNPLHRLPFWPAAAEEEEEEEAPAVGRVMSIDELLADGHQIIDQSVAPVGNNFVDA